MASNSDLYESFRTNGFCLVEDIASEAVIQRNLELLLAVAGEHRLKKTFSEHHISHVDDLFSFDQSVAEHFCHPTVLELLARILGENIRLTFSALVINEPGKKRSNMHCDWPYNQHTACHFPAPYAGHPVGHINTMLMLSDFSPENGGTIVVPRSHLRNTNPTHNDPDLDENIQYDDEIGVYGKSGTMAFFDSRLWHCSPANSSSSLRRVGVIVRYAAWWLNLETLNPHSVLRKQWVDDSGVFENYYNRIPRSAFDKLPPAMQPMVEYMIAKEGEDRFDCSHVVPQKDS